MLRGTKTLVLDEGDRLLDEGFERQLSQIIEASSRSRQTLCFSATMPADLKRMLDSGAVRSEYERVDATGAAGRVDQTASRVDLRRRVALPKGADALGALANVLKKHREGRSGSKVVVFLPTTAAAELASAYLANRGLSNNALHSRKSQGYRTRTSNEFRDADVAREHALLVATDVAARGVDYPGVSLVVQAGTPDNREQFVHRSGRTGRAGTAGEAVLLVEDWEFALASDMPSDSVEMLDVDAAPLLDTDEAVADDSQKAMNRVAPDVRRKAYVGWLCHTNARCKVLGWSKQELVDRANAMAREDYLLRETPSLTPRAVGFMGLSTGSRAAAEVRAAPGRRGSLGKPRRSVCLCVQPVPAAVRGDRPPPRPTARRSRRCLRWSTVRRPASARGARRPAPATDAAAFSPPRGRVGSHSVRRRLDVRPRAARRSDWRWEGAAR